MLCYKEKGYQEKGVTYENNCNILHDSYLFTGFLCHSSDCSG